MRIQFKLLFLVAFVLVGVLSAVIWKTNDFIEADKLSSIYRSTSEQLNPLRRLVQIKLDFERDQIASFAQHRLNGRASSRSQEKATLWNSYSVVGLLRLNETGSWSASWVDKSPELRDEHWPKHHEMKLFKEFPYGKIKDGEVVWTRMSDGKGEPIYVIAFSAEQLDQLNQTTGSLPDSPTDGAQALPETAQYAPADTGEGRSSRVILVGFTYENPVASIADDYIGSTKNIYIVDHRGFVASHSIKSWIGANLTQDSVVREILSSQRANGYGRFEDMNSQPVVGQYEKIQQTNLYAIAETPDLVIASVKSTFLRLALLVGGAVGVLSFILTWVLGAGVQRQLDQVENSFSMEAGETRELEQISKDNEGEVEPQRFDAREPKSLANNMISLERLAAERRAVFDSFNEGLAKELKEPLLAILGHAQLIKEKLDDGEAKSHADSITREARHAKSVLERLQGFGVLDEEWIETDEFNLKRAVESVLWRKREHLADHQIALESRIEEVPDLPGDGDHIMTAIENIVDNAVQAMLRRPQKTLKVDLRYFDGQVELSVSDTGIGMNRDVKAKAFEPFFKAFDSAQDHMGLGLTYVQMTLKRVGGRCEIESSPGEGSKFELVFPVAEKNKKEFLMRTQGLAKSEATVEDVFRIQEDDSEEMVIHESQPLPNEKTVASAGLDDLDWIENESKEDLVAITFSSMPSDLSFEDEDDDIEEFTNIPLATAVDATGRLAIEEVNASHEPVVESKEIAFKESDKFQVKIRRPKSSDDSQGRV